MEKSETYAYWYDKFHYDELETHDYNILIKMLLSDKKMYEWFQLEMGINDFMEHRKRP